jgi:uncharacterized membrane protein YkvA (DUF1232 family)
MPLTTSQEDSVRQGFFPKLARVFAAVPFAEEMAAAYYCAFDPATPIKAKGILVGALAYFILPFDIVPDFILGLGFTDDIAVLFAALNVIRTHMKPHHRAKARDTLERIRRGEELSL